MSQVGGKRTGLDDPGQEESGRHRCGIDRRAGTHELARGALDVLAVGVTELDVTAFLWNGGKK